MQLANGKVLEHLKESVREVFTVMLNTVAALVEPGSETESGTIEECGLDSERVKFEAVVHFEGTTSGAVILRCCAGGAKNIARNLLMMEDGEEVDIDEVKDALGECANMVTGSLKTRALDPNGAFNLGTPVIDARVELEHEHQAGRLVYRLSQGSVAVEIWFSEEV